MSIEKLARVQQLATFSSIGREEIVPRPCVLPAASSDLLKRTSCISSLQRCSRRTLPLQVTKRHQKRSPAVSKQRGVHRTARTKQIDGIIHGNHSHQRKQSQPENIFIIAALKQKKIHGLAVEHLTSFYSIIIRRLTGSGSRGRCGPPGCTCSTSWARC